MLEFTSEKLTERITRIFAFNTELMYLVEGSSAAALLDTGSGFGNLKAYIETLTDKPIIVLTTHGHVDHAMGAKQFEKVYMSHLDFAPFREHGRDEVRWNSLVIGPIREYRDTLTQADYIPTDDPNRFIDLHEGDVFDLGGVSVVPYACPGHTPGSMAMLIREERALLLGDACNPRTFLFGTYASGINTYQKSLEALRQKTDGLYDRVLISHGSGNGSVRLIEGNIGCCKSILAGQADNVPFCWEDKGYVMAFATDKDGARLDGGVGNIVYDKEKMQL